MSIGQVVDWAWESWLCTRLGIGRDELRELRKKLLVEGPDFRIEKNRVVISPAGEKKLRAHLKVPPESPQAPPAPPKPAANGGGPEPEKTAPRRAQAEIVTLLVWRANLPNRRIVEAYLPGKDPHDRRNVLRVRVKDAGRFNRFDNTGKPMEIPTVHVQADLYELAGPAPRRKGRW